MRINWKKTTIVLLDILLGVYLVMAMTSFNKPDVTSKVCTKVNIHILDETSDGFLKAAIIKQRLEACHVYPINQPLHQIDCRNIETLLKKSPFVENAECFKTQDGEVKILLSQRMPTLRIKSNNGDDYYIDDNNRIMPNSNYTSDLIIATGNIDRQFATSSLAFLSRILMSDDLWKNQIEQINVLSDKGIELIPRVGDHVIYIGILPKAKNPQKQEETIKLFITSKLDRLEKFYRYGLSQAGWNKYKYINLDFENQIICKRR